MGGQRDGIGTGLRHKPRSQVIGRPALKIEHANKNTGNWKMMTQLGNARRSKKVKSTLAG